MEVRVLHLLAAAALLAPLEGGQLRAADADRDVMVRRIDEFLGTAWAEAGVTPAPSISDAEFLRRVSLDLNGVTPSVTRVRDFLADERPDKRERLVDELLESRRYATHMATTWRHRLLPSDDEAYPPAQVVGVQRWLRDRFTENLRYDNLVADLLVATDGSEMGPALYFQAHDLAPEKLAASTSELFLGVKLGCAQCHDHPYEEWSQRDFWGYAAFFARVQGPDNMGMMSRGSFQLVDGNRGEVTLPESDEIVPPKYLGGPEAEDRGGQSRRRQLAIWIASPGNPLVPRSAVDWAWSHMFGRGVLHPDGEIVLQPPKTAPLGDELGDYFEATGFDLKQLWRTIALTDAYQRASTPSDPEQPAYDLFATMHVRALTPEQFYDSVVQASPPLPVTSGDYSPTGAAYAMGLDQQRMAFVRQMRSPTTDPTEYGAGILQTLMLSNGPVTSSVTSAAQGRLLAALEAPMLDDQQRVDALYLATLSREPEYEEKRRFVDYLQSQAESGQGAALGDVFWALINSSEFAFNH